MCVCVCVYVYMYNIYILIYNIKLMILCQPLNRISITLYIYFFDELYHQGLKCYYVNEFRSSVV